jgi:CheY-like chemotaxis protein
VITDKTMPQLSGLQLAQELLHLRPDLPIIMCSGYSEEPERLEMKATGIRAVLNKPLEKHELAEIISKVMEQE